MDLDSLIIYYELIFFNKMPHFFESLLKFYEYFTIDKPYKRAFVTNLNKYDVEFMQKN